MSVEWTVPESREVLPRDRADYVAGLLSESTYGNGPALEGLAALLSDIRHYCDAHGVDFGVADRAAMEYYRLELLTPQRLRAWGKELESVDPEARSRAAHTLAAVVIDGPSRLADRASEWLRSLAADAGRLAELSPAVCAAVTKAAGSHAQPTGKFHTLVPACVGRLVGRSR